MFFCEVCAEGVYGDVDGTSVCFEGEDFGHDFEGGAADFLAEGVEVFEVGFVEGVTDDFDVEVVEIVGGEAFSEVGGLILGDWV